MILLRRRRNRKKRAVCVRDILYWNNVKLTLLFLLWCPFPHFFDFLFASSLFFYVCLTSWSSSSMICLDLLFMPDEHLFSWCPHHFLFFFPSLLFSLHESLTSWTLSSFLVSLLWLPSPDEFPASFFVIVLSCLFSPSSQCFTQQMSVEREREREEWPVSKTSQSTIRGTFIARKMSTSFPLTLMVSYCLPSSTASLCFLSPSLYNVSFFPLFLIMIIMMQTQRRLSDLCSLHCMLLFVFEFFYRQQDEHKKALSLNLFLV